MARKRPALRVTLTQVSIADPRSVEEGLQLWAMYLARHARELLERGQPQEVHQQTSEALVGD